MVKRISITILLLAAVLLAWGPLEASQEPESLSYAGKLPPTALPPVPWGKDPFVPALKGAGAKSQDFKLTAIFFNPRRSSAIIDDRIVYKGSEIKGQKVIDIGRAHVILQGDAGTLRLEIAGISGAP